MKHLILIGGTMGVGKTTVCQILKHKLTPSVFLDGDWCWDANPFTVTDETKAMVNGNALLVSELFCIRIRALRLGDAPARGHRKRRTGSRGSEL